MKNKKEEIKKQKTVTTVADNGLKLIIPISQLEICPDCGKRSVRAKELYEGGGVKCITENCGYWFCY